MTERRGTGEERHDKIGSDRASTWGKKGHKEKLQLLSFCAASQPSLPNENENAVTRTTKDVYRERIV